MSRRRQKYLFVCHANENRSPTAERACKIIAGENNLQIIAASAGVSKASNNPLTRDIADKADRIFIMEYEMGAILQEQYKQNPGKIICLDIPDVYLRDDPQLIKILEDKLYAYLAQAGLL